MLKYYALAIVVLGAGLYYVYITDPCHQQVRADFAEMHPGYEILGSDALEGSPESVRCQISYRKPEAGQIYQDIWMYQRAKDGWSFSKILKTGEKEPTP